MKKSLIIIAAAFFGFASQTLAQSENNDDEIIVTDAQGKQEVIDLPVQIIGKVLSCKTYF